MTEDTDKFEDFKLPIRILSKSFEIQFSKELPSITQVDFIKEIVNHNTQIYVEINVSKNYVLIMTCL